MTTSLLDSFGFFPKEVCNSMNTRISHLSPDTSVKGLVFLDSIFTETGSPGRLLSAFHVCFLTETFLPLVYTQTRRHGDILTEAVSYLELGGVNQVQPLLLTAGAQRKK